MSQQTENSDRSSTPPENRSRVDWADIGVGILGASPAIAMGLVYVSSAFSLGQSFVNATAAQDAMNQVARGATVAECELLLERCKKRASNPSVQALCDLLKNLLEETHRDGKDAPRRV